MELCFLKILEMLESRGYYARTNEEIRYLLILTELGYAVPKKGRKSVFLITDAGKDHIDRLLRGRKSISDEEFFQCIKSTFGRFTSPMNPIARIPDLRRAIVTDLRISDGLFDEKLINLLENNNVNEFLEMASSLIEEAGECGFRSIAILLGALSELKIENLKFKILSYEGPFGVGYLVANVEGL